jgi:hypothetical protein
VRELAAGDDPAVDLVGRAPARAVALAFHPLALDANRTLRYTDRMSIQRQIALRTHVSTSRLHDGCLVWWKRVSGEEWPG